MVGKVKKLSHVYGKCGLAIECTFYKASRKNEKMFKVLGTHAFATEAMLACSRDKVYIAKVSKMKIFFQVQQNMLSRKMLFCRDILRMVINSSYDPR